MTTLFIFLAGVLGTLATGSGSYHEEFHQTYALEAHGRVVLENINGDVHITAWDRNEVKVDAAKSAYSQERLDDDTSEMPVRQVSDHRPSIEDHMVYQVRMDEVRQAIRTLPEKQRAAVLMHKYEEMEYSQIAKVLNCSESAVKSLLFRAYEALRARLAHMA